MSSPSRFAIVTSQRTGSTLLVRSLDSAQAVFCAGELFHAGQHVHHREYQYPLRVLGSVKAGKVVDAFLQNQRVERHLDRFFSEAGSGVDAVGFKLMVSQCRHFPRVLPHMREIGVKCLYLHRRDTFSTALSYYKAQKSGLYHSDRLPKSGRPLSIEADASAFEQLLETCRNDKKTLLELQHSFGGALLSYEDMIENWDQFISKIGSEIGLPDLRVPKALKKVGTRTDVVSITNEDWLRARYSESSRE